MKIIKKKLIKSDLLSGSNKFKTEASSDIPNRLYKPKLKVFKMKIIDPKLLSKEINWQKWEHKFQQNKVDLPSLF